MRPARVEYVQGEFYWRVEQGETVRAIDYVVPPLMLSQEITNTEVNWSIGTYLTNREIEKAFNVSDLPKPFSVAPNHPFTDGFYIKYGFANARRSARRRGVDDSFERFFKHAL
jgi:hypothetical protein